MSADPIFCSECGNPNAPDAAFCESCGKPLDDAAPAPAAAPAAPPAAQPGRKVSSRVLAIGAVVILGGAGAAYLASRPTSNPGAGDGGSGSDSTGEVTADSFPTGDSIILIPSGPGSHTTISGGGVIARGAVLTLLSNERVCSNTNAVGDQFIGVVERTVMGSNGARIPGGTSVTMLVDRANNAELVVSVQSIDLGDTTYLLSAIVDAVDLKSGDGLPPMPALPPGIPSGSVVTRAPGGSTGGRCIEPNAEIRVTLQEELRLGAP